MANFSRAVDVRMATWPLLPEPLVSWGATGKAQVRALASQGWQWTEVCQTFDGRSQVGRGFLAHCLSVHRSKVVMDVDHALCRTLLGTGAGSPLVQGGGQTGTSIVTDGWGISQTVLRAGDILTIAGSTVVRMMTADAVSNGSGVATLNLQPGVLVAPADNAVITITPPVRIKAILIALEIPEAQENGYVEGLQLQWREQPS